MYIRMCMTKLNFFIRKIHLFFTLGHEKPFLNPSRVFVDRIDGHIHTHTHINMHTYIHTMESEVNRHQIYVLFVSPPPSNYYIRGGSEISRVALEGYRFQICIHIGLHQRPLLAMYNIIYYFIHYTNCVCIIYFWRNFIGC